MSYLLLIVAISVMPHETGGTENEPPRAYHQIQRDLRDVIRRHARAESPLEAAQIIQRMCTLYLEIKRDPRRASSPTLRGYQAKLWSKLKQIETDIERQLSQQQRGVTDPRPSVEERDSPGERLAWEASGSLAGTLSLVGSTLGGPGELLAHGGSFGGAAAPSDLGPALVELIQRTIAPEFWDVNGGPGTIVYFAPLRVLVVRATSEIHHRIGGAVGGLRRAGR